LAETLICIDYTPLALPDGLCITLVYMIKSLTKLSTTLKFIILGHFQPPDPSNVP